MNACAEPMLKLEELAVAFHTRRGILQAVRCVDLEVERGEIVGIVGESGSGKSVTLRAITKLLHTGAHVGGRVLWRGEDLATFSESRLTTIRGRQIAMIFQEPMTALNPVMTIGQQIEESLGLLGRYDRAGRSKRAAELMGLVGIASAKQRLANYPHEFSGGMRQRAMIAIAIAAEPALLLADEPTTALDVTIQDQILKLLTGLATDLGMALVLVTHDLGVVAETCDNVCVMYAGRIVEKGPVTALFSQPHHAYTHALLRAMPGKRQARQPLASIPGQPPRLDAMPAGCAFAPRCSFAEDRCRSLAPPLMAVAPGHAVACWAADRVASTAAVTS